MYLAILKFFLFVIFSQSMAPTNEPSFSSTIIPTNWPTFVPTAAPLNLTPIPSLQPTGPSPSPTFEKNYLSEGEIAGIIIGGVIFLIFWTVLRYYLIYLHYQPLSRLKANPDNQNWIVNENEKFASDEHLT